MPILIVDDDPTIRDLATLLLTQAGFDQVMAADGPPQAFKLLGLDPPGAGEIMPDVILMDIMMPEINGIEACAHIKLDPRFADIPILMVTTLADIEHLKKAFMAGATDYMTKPIRPEELLARVRSAHRFKRELDRRKAREAELGAIAQQAIPAVSAKAESDTATGLFGEAALLSTLDWGLAKREGVLIMLGADAWDSFHDRYSQERCDMVATEIAAALSHQSAHLGDQLFRIGAARFALIFPHAQPSQAQGHADRWRNVVAALKIPHAFSAVGPWLTMSCGAVALGGWQGSRADLLAEALSMMVLAEASGGNASFVSKNNGRK